MSDGQDPKLYNPGHRFKGRAGFLDLFYSVLGECPFKKDVHTFESGYHVSSGNSVIQQKDPWTWNQTKLDWSLWQTDVRQTDVKGATTISTSWHLCPYVIPSP